MIIKILFAISLIFSITFFVNTLHQPKHPTVPPVFPNAKGFGTETPAGRGGKILRVTNLNDSGPGSLREAVNTSGPRIIVFEKSGRIDLKSNLVLREPYCTIAGQTAPAQGIMISGRTFVITTHDVLVQHIAIRVGDEGKNRDGSWDSTDSIQIINSGAYNVVIDHVSASWSIDENISTGYGSHDITVSNSIVSEPLNNSVHSKSVPHGFNLFGAKEARQVSFINNLLAHGEARNPYFQGCTALFANNLVYNNGTTVPQYISISSDSTVTSPWYVSIVGNAFVDGPNSRNSYAITEWAYLTHAASQTYHADNRYNKSIYYGTKKVSTPPSDSWPSDFVALSSGNVESFVLANAGSRPGARDDVDERIVNEVITRTGRIIDSQGEVGGFPSYGEDYRSFEVLNPNGDDDNDGYTNIEEVLHKLAAEVE